MPIREFTVSAYAEREQVTKHTVYQWIAKGALKTRRTAGGGVRIVETIRDDAHKPTAADGKP